MTLKDTVVLYHKDCPDGFGAAYAAWLVLGASADYVPCTYGYTDGLLDRVAGKQVFVLDFSFSSEFMLELETVVTQLTLLDHHKTARDGLQCLHCGPKLSLLFDLEKSGAMLAWEYFHPDRPAPALFHWIQDRDLWRWKIPNSKDYLAVLDTLPQEFAAWMDFDITAQTKPESLLESGRLINAKLDQMVTSAEKEAFELDFEGHSVWAVNCPQHELVSELGSRLAKKSGTFSIVFRQSKKNEMRISLRAVPSFDAAPIAQKFGGGGHPQACAFKCTPQQWLTLLGDI